MKRIEWIDICKAIAIFCMVFLHVGLELPHRCNGLDTVLHYWHMPIFIFLSGTVLNPDKHCGWQNFPKFFMSRVKSLLVPLIAFGFICLIFNTLYLFPDGVPAKRGTFMQHIFHPNLYLYKFDLQWFLMCLFATEVIYVLMHNIAGGRKWLIAVFTTAFLAGGHFLVKKYTMFPFASDTVVYALPMFTLGALCRNLFLEARPFKKWWAQVLLFAGIVAASILVTGKFNVRAHTYDPLWIYPFGLVLTMLVIMLIREQEGWITKLKCYDGIKWLGSNTLAILVLNGSVRKIIPWRNLVTSDNILLVFGVQIIGTFVTIFIIYFLVKLVMRYCPWALGKFPKKVPATKSAE